MASIYSLAFVSDALDFIIKEGLNAIPAENKFSGTGLKVKGEIGNELAKDYMGN